MSFFTLSVPERIDNFMELLSCCESVNYWTYAADGTLLTTNCQELILDRVFRYAGCLDRILEHAASRSEPLILSVPLGLTWCAAFEKTEEGLSAIHVLGPVATEGLTRGEIGAMLDESTVMIANRARLFRAFEQLPVVSLTNCIRNLQMLHYCLTGEKILPADIQFVSYSDSVLQKGKKAKPKDRMKTWMNERALMRMITEGDLNYKPVLSAVARESTGVDVNTKSELLKAKVTQIVFISNSTRAAIDGGVSPETAYTRGDAYIQDVMDSKTISDVGFIGRTMYEDFINLVRNTRRNPNYSKQVQSCCDYIDLHIDEKLLLSEIAGRIGYADYYLSRKFKEETGTSINDYIKTAKIERAKTLLVTSDLSIQEICDTLSFGPRSFFAQTFKEVVGIPPARYRKLNQKI